MTLRSSGLGGCQDQVTLRSSGLGGCQDQVTFRSSGLGGTIEEFRSNADVGCLCLDS